MKTHLRRRWPLSKKNVDHFHSLGCPLAGEPAPTPPFKPDLKRQSTHAGGRTGWNFACAEAADSDRGDAGGHQQGAAREGPEPHHAGSLPHTPTHSFSLPSSLHAKPSKGASLLLLLPAVGFFECARVCVVCVCTPFHPRRHSCLQVAPISSLPRMERGA